MSALRSFIASVTLLAAVLGAGPARAAARYALAFWREPGAWENHGNHSAFVHVWDENGQPLAGRSVYTSWGVLLGATDANGFVEIELRRPNGYDFQVRDGGSPSDTTPVLSVERAPNWGFYSYEIGFVRKSNGGGPGTFDTRVVGAINSSGSDLCRDLSAPFTRSLAYYSTVASEYCSDQAALGAWTASHGQTFVATGNRVVAVKAMMAAGFDVHYYWTAQILDGGPGGTPLGPAHSTRLFVDGEYYPILVKWGFNDVQVIPGRTYYLQIARDQGLNVWRVNQDQYAGGNYFENGAPVPGAELMGLVLCATYTNAGPVGTIAGTVRDRDSRPLGGVLVRVPDAALYTTTDPGGAYSLLSVPAATYDVTATRDGFATAVRSGVAVQADGTATVDFQLSAASTAVDGTILTPGYSLAPFDLAPAWSSAFDATWGSAASFAIVAPGQTGAALQTSRSGPGSSARVLVLPLRTNTPYQASVWARCPRYSSPYWAECGYRFGAKTAQDFDGNSTAWTLLRRFTDTGVNGNANQWTRYTATFNSGANQQVSFGFKIGATASTGPTVQWDELSLVTLALPVPLAAVAQTETSLVVPFPEPLNPATATNAANYSLLDGAGALWPLGAAGLQGTNVVLETGPLSPRTDFWLTVSNVLLAPQPAQLGGLNGTLPVRLPRPAIALDQTESWRYWASGTDPGAAWQSADFDDSGWAAGPALLGHALGTLPQPIATEISPVPNRYTVYFRRSFVVPPGYTNAWLRLEPIVDDGAVFHLNGAEVLRLGMTNGTFNAGSAATRSVGQADFEGPFILPKAKLVAGRNVLAAELHQSAASDPDLVFGVRADLLVLPSQTPPPDVLLLLSTGPDAWTLSWASAAMVLESAPQIQGPWTPVPDATSPWVIPTADRAGFFRLRE